MALDSSRIRAAPRARLSHFCSQATVNSAGFSGDSNSLVGWSITTKTTNKLLSELRTRGLWMVLDGAGQHESHGVAIVPVSSKIGGTPQTLNE